MPWLAWAVPAAATLVSGILQSSAQGGATEAQEEAAQDALDFQREYWKTTREDLAPYRQLGVDALPEMQRIAGETGDIDPTTDKGYWKKTSLTDPGDFRFSTTGPDMDPSYKWRLDQGLAGVESSAAARGGYFSGNTGKALMDYGQGAASQEYGNQFGRWDRKTQRYMDQEAFNQDVYDRAWTRQIGQNAQEFGQQATMAGLGENAAALTGTAGSQLATNAGNIAIGQGRNVAAGATGQANIWSNVLSNISNQFMGAWGQRQQENQLNEWKLDHALLQRQISNPTAYGPAY